MVVISEAFANRLLPGRNPLGEWIKVDGTNRQVVGIAADAPSSGLHESPQPYLFLPYTQVRLDDLTLMVETAVEPGALERAVRQELLRYDSRAKVYSAGTLRQQMDIALSWDRMMASIASGLGLFGVLLTAAGLFGVLQYIVNLRTRELGLRMAMGAGAFEIQKLILGESLKMAAWGVPIGLVALGAAVHGAESMLLGVSPLDWRVYCLSGVAVSAVTLLAGWMPARRATRVDPMEALRPE